MKKEQYQCKSYYDDDYKLQDCECGKCDKKDIEQEIMEMFDEKFLAVTGYEGDVEDAPNYFFFKSFISHIITLVQKREREEMVERFKGMCTLVDDGDCKYFNDDIHKRLLRGNKFVAQEILSNLIKQNK